MAKAQVNAGGPQPTSGKAVTSLVFGILGLLCFLPFIGPIIAIILGHISRSEIKRSQGELGGEGLAIGGLVTGYAGLVMLIPLMAILAGMMLPVLEGAREKARRVNDAGNLKQFGLACLMYSGDHDGDFPPDAATLVEDDYIQLGQVWICPNTENSPPTSVEQIRNGTGTDYVYVGNGLRDDNANATRTVIMYTKPGAFNNWMNFLFIDGHVEGTRASSAEEAAAQRGWTIGKQ